MSNQLSSVQTFNKVLVFYHEKCLDGMTAAALIYHRKPAQLVAVNYHEDIPKVYSKLLEQLEEMIFVDLPIHVVSKIINMYVAADRKYKIVMFDHHPIAPGAAMVANIDELHHTTDKSASKIVAEHYGYENTLLLRAVNANDLGDHVGLMEQKMIMYLVVMLKVKHPFELLTNRLIQPEQEGMDRFADVMTIQRSYEAIKSTIELVVQNSAMDFVKIKFRTGDVCNALLLYVVFPSSLIWNEYYKRAPRYVQLFICVYKSNSTCLLVMRKSRQHESSIDLNVIAKAYEAGGHPGAASIMVTREEFTKMIS